MEFLPIIMFLILVLGFVLGYGVHIFLDDSHTREAVEKLKRIHELNEDCSVLKKGIEVREQRYAAMLITNINLNNRVIELEHILKVMNSTVNKPTTTTVGLNLNSEDLKRLIMLCHPDKHGGKTMAVEMTKKLYDLRT